ncbi:putative disease resistance protein At3g14460 [Arachis stenosperma]|uniref:putative disease resistance protein At3g14460 n=1 Tax=Arachis stenosperma TaxID=217475 RepID=UPI0025AB7EBD|nr:putative disease resistance protein At3g14460 [Arachis stenosperma]XP_057741552.1 putative disease resistance protein At3g14460 [Arachis stenosperma]XP_057741553.1 putative disease resistance protein At3g14460 [Arachis stenosperma]XP_057741554.1 putative disease resistance protein At3g14460 [Arachis stenosperma]XP_057741555.1 putative disease resistance protein At3g14460 [Arachis stenosperma]XP_057741556.1 putative disease resistance protein At3g14460 [Arachis stenosperma]XP_057741557.1 pu
MAGALVGGALLSGFINVVFDRFLTTDAVHLVLGKKLGPDLVERLKTALLGAEALVADAELKQFGNPSVRKWLDSLRDAVYHAEDLLDAVLLKATTQKNVSSSWSLSFFTNRDRDDMVDKMEGVVRRIEDLGKQKDFLGLEKIPTVSSSWRTPTSSIVRGNVYGREDDKKALIKMLNDNSEHHLSVIAIVGIGGVGKTTLAQWVYNNAELMEGFDRKAWVCVSENFNIVETTKNIVKEISTNTQDPDSFNSIQDALKKELSEKKFFVVLDDVWSNDQHQWRNFIAPFQYGAKGSTILLTTRKENVGLVAQTNYQPLILNTLSEDQCWSVFAYNASFPESNGSPALVEIGKKITKKCDGLPLAAETLGCLCRNHDAEEWGKILKSDIWEFSTNDSKIIPALLISYYHLPPHLKRCFVYCSLFPKGYKLEKYELILLWMAEDLLQVSNRRETLEEVGSKYFDDLASRLFFKKLQDDDHYYAMHDLLHDLAIFLAGDFYCRLEELGEEEELGSLTRHLSFGKLMNRSVSKSFNSIATLKSLRTSLNVNDLFSMESVASKFKYLRVLSFDELDEVPNSIGELIHLRHLDLSYTDIKTLPESLCSLCNLQTLKLRGCSELTTLPSGLHNLVSLRHLDIRKTSLEEMPRKMSKLNQLHVLSSFVIGKHEDNGIQELGGLVNLHGSLEIKKLENIVNVKEAKMAKIMDKKHIDELWLEWSSGDDLVSSTETERDMLDNLQPQNGLKELEIKGYKGTIFPDWVGNCSYQNMTSVSLECCKNCCMLPSLGQLPSLKSLRIRGFDQLRSIGGEFYKNEGDHSSHIAPFPSLERLKFDDMACWEVWHVSESETFPQLRKLQITNCRMLKEEMLNQVFFRIVSSLSDVSKVRKLHIYDYLGQHTKTMKLNGDSLSVWGCESVRESAFKAIMNMNHLSCLQEMDISGCSSHVSFPGNCFPKSLQKLEIRRCRKLGFPQLQQHKYDLVELLIEESCDSLTSLSLDVFPNLKNLHIHNCWNLESVSMSEAPHAALQRLSITLCSKLVSFAGEGLAAPNLTHLSITHCYKLEALPRDMKSLLPSLHSLNIYGCPNICRLAEGGLPPNLKSLGVGGCEEQLRDLSRMANFHALTHLTISGYNCDNIKLYPEVGSLPHLPSLTTLEICWFHNLETLECNELLRLTSLQQLQISCCQKLQNMKGEKLPPSLFLLQISYCGLLEEHCRNKHQLIWHKISHIPTIQVKGKLIV